MQIRFVKHYLCISALSCRCCSGDVSIRGDPHCLPADDQQELVKLGQTQTHKHKTLSPPPPSSPAATFSFANPQSTWLSQDGERNWCRKPGGRATDQSTSGQMGRQQTGRRSHTETQKKTTARHDGSHLFSTFAVTLFHKHWPVAAQWSIRAQEYWLRKSNP